MRDVLNNNILATSDLKSPYMYAENFYSSLINILGPRAQPWAHYSLSKGHFFKNFSYTHAFNAPHAPGPFARHQAAPLD